MLGDRALRKYIRQVDEYGADRLACGMGVERMELFRMMASLRAQRCTAWQAFNGGFRGSRRIGLQMAYHLALDVLRLFYTAARRPCELADEMGVFCTSGPDLPLVPRPVP